MLDASYLHTVLTHVSVSWESDNGPTAIVVCYSVMCLPKVFDHEKEIENKDIF